jgi:hypothetical protein
VESSNPDLHDVSEKLSTIVIPTVEPITAEFLVTYRRSLGDKRGLADLRTFEYDYWDDSDGGEAMVSAEFEVKGPWSLDVDGVVLKRMVRLQMLHRETHPDCTCRIMKRRGY